MLKTSIASAFLFISKTFLSLSTNKLKPLTENIYAVDNSCGGEVGYNFFVYAC